MCRDDFEQVKSIGRCVEKDWRELLADCFPKIMVNILPYFALSSQDARVAQQQETAHRVYDLLKDASCLGKQVSRSAHPAAVRTSVWIGFLSVITSLIKEKAELSSARWMSLLRMQRRAAELDSGRAMCNI